MVLCNVTLPCVTSPCASGALFMECGRRKSDLQQINYRHVAAAAVEFRSVAISFFVSLFVVFPRR